MLKTKWDYLQVSFENLSEDKNMLQRKVTELEMDKATTEEK